MIIKSAKFCSYLTFKIFGWCIILLALAKLAFPFFLPLTINDQWVEEIVGRYFQPVKIGSVHIVMDEGRPSLLLQNIDTHPQERQGLHVTRAYVSPSFTKSLFTRKWVFHKITLYSGEMHMGFSKDHVRLGAVKVPIHPEQPLPVWVHHLNLKHLKVHLDEIPELSEVFIHEVHLLNPKTKGFLRAKLSEDRQKVAAADIRFDFEKHYDDISGQLYVRGYDHNLTRLFKLLHWPGSSVDGKADFEFWADVNKGAVASAVLDLNGTDLALNKPTTKLEIKELSGKLGYKREKGSQHWQGDNLKLRLVDSVHKTQFQIDSENDQTYVIHGKNFDIGLVHFIVQDIPQVDKFFQSFDVHPTGNIPYVKMVFDRPTAKLQSVLLNGEKLAFSHKDVAAHNLEGQLYYQGSMLQAKLQGRDATVDSPNWLSDTNSVQQYSVDGTYYLGRQLLNVNAEFVKEGEPIQGKLALMLHGEPWMALGIQAKQLSEKSLAAWLPMKKFSPGFVRWFNRSLKAGEFKNLNLSYDGFAKDFASATNPNPFKLQTQVVDATVDYAPPWPALALKAGHIEMSNHQFVLNGSGLLDKEDAKVKSISATIDDLRKKSPRLIVQGQLQTDLKPAWEVMHQTKLVDSSLFEQLSMNGDADLDIKLQFDLKDQIKTQVWGQLRFDKSQLQPLGLPELRNASGALRFDSHGMSSSMFKGYTYENPVDLKLELAFGPSGHLNLNATGDLDLAQMNVKGVEGKAPFDAQFNWAFHKDHARAQANLDIENVSVDVPYPFHKDKGVKEGLQFAFDIEPGRSALMAVDWPDKMLAHVLFEKNSRTIGAKAVGIHFGEADGTAISLPSQDLQLSGHLQQVDYGDWRSYLGPNSHKNPQRQIAVDLKVEDFISPGLYLKDAQIKGRFDPVEQLVQGSVDSAKLKGEVDLSFKPDGAWDIHLDRLILSKKLDLPSQMDVPRHPIKLKVGEFENALIRLNHLNLVLIPNDEGFVIHDLSFKINNSSVDLAGVWHNQTKPEHVKLAGGIETDNVSDLLASMGKPLSIRGAGGTVDFDVAYKGALFQPEWETLRGQGELSLKSGSIPGVNPGIGRILSLLNLDTFQRRLQLDFSDVTKEGYAFDTLDGRFTIGHGVIKTDRLRLEAPTANVDFYGDMGLVSKQLSAEVAVMPNLTGSLPLAAAIAAGNPAIGAAVWVMDKFIGRKIQAMTRYTYVVSGTVDSPDIKEVDYRNKHDKKITRR